jgi:hypothetical protein
MESLRIRVSGKEGKTWLGGLEKGLLTWSKRLSVLSPQAHLAEARQSDMELGKY